MKKLLIFTIMCSICIFSLLSCSKIKDDPFYVSEILDSKKYYVEVSIDKDDIEDFADEVDVTCKGVYCIMLATPEADEDEQKSGIFAFCENKKSAKAIEDDFKDLLDDEDFEDYLIRATVERKGTVVFLGCEDVLDHFN